MKRVNRQQLDEYFNKLFQGVTKEYFKLEVLQNYSDEDEDNSPSLKAFRRGDKATSLKLLQEEIKQTTPWFAPTKRIKKIRIHIVKLPLTPYLEWEIEWYKAFNIPKVGEQIFLINQNKAVKQGIKLPKGDLIILDNTTVIVNEYESKQGGVIGSRVYVGPEEIKPFLKLKKQLLKLAVSLEDFDLKLEQR